MQIWERIGEGKKENGTQRSLLRKGKTVKSTEEKKLKNASSCERISGPEDLKNFLVWVRNW